MAEMYPTQPPPRGIGRDGEWKVYVTLQDAFPDDGWYIFYDLRFWSDASCTIQRNLDFVIVNASLGVLMIEVKGGQYDYRPPLGWCKKHREQWYPDDKYGGPYAQLNTAAFAFVSAACKALGWDAKKPPFRHGQGVIFPFCELTRVDGRLPADADGEITAESHICDSPQRLRAWIMGRMQSFAKAFPGSGKTFEKYAQDVVKKYLAPRVEAYTRLASIIALNQDLEDLLTADQQAYVKLAVGKQRVLFEGFAGTGKTFMAVLLGTRIASALATTPGVSSRVAILCFNENLANQIDRDMLPPGHSLRVRHFHGFLRELFAMLGILEPESKDQDYYNTKCVELLVKAGSAGKTPRYSTILIDEGQDFLPHWVHAIETSLLAPGGQLFVFYDPLQDVRGLGTDLAKAYGEPLPIRTNCRNTRQIANFIRNLDSILWEMEIARFAPEGVPPIIKTYARSHEQCPDLEDLIMSLIQKHDVKPRQIVLLSPFTKSNTCIAERSQLAGVPLVDYSKRYSDQRPQVLFYETIMSFKGCEADIVILHDIHGEGKNVSLENLYVACSRARAGLFVFRAGDFTWPSAQMG